MSYQPKTIILSAELSRLSVDVNQKRTLALLNALIYHDIAFKSVVGSYKGTFEHAFKVSTENTTLIKRLAFKDFMQESILIIGEDETNLLYSDNNMESIGKYSETTREDAMSKENYTQEYDAKDKELKYFICK